MAKRKFEGRTAAEAAIRACEVLGVARSQLTYDVVSDEGEGLDRHVVIEAEVNEDAAPPPPRAARDDDDDDNDNRGNRRSDRPERSERRDGGGRRGRGGRRGDRDSRRDRDRDRGRSRGRRRRSEEADNDGIESLLNLEILPSERGPDRPEVEGERSEQANRAMAVVTDLVGLLSADITPRLVEDGEEEIHVDLKGDGEARVIGKKGEALLALQFVVNRIVGRENEEGPVVVLDAANYRGRRREALSDLAKRLAERAMEEGKVVRLSPMSAHDRRVFHLTLKEQEGVDTRSEGDGLHRNLLIIPSQFLE